MADGEVVEFSFIADRRRFETVELIAVLACVRPNKRR